MNLKKTLKLKYGKTRLYKYYKITKQCIEDLPQIISEPLFRLFPIDNNKIVFSSFNGTQFNAQPRLIYEELLKRNKSIEYVWICPPEKINDKRIRVIKPNSVKAVYELMTAHVWIDNTRKKFWIIKRKKQKYFQTWHGPICLKAVEKDTEETLPPEYVKGAIRDSKNADYLVAECKWRKNNIQQAFWYNGPLIEGEFKQKKLLSKQQTISNVKKYFNLKESAKIVLYAPTFRDDCSLDCYIKNYDEVLDVFNNKYPGDWFVLVRLHPNVANKSNFISYSSNVLNATEYPSIQDLELVADYIISDYSGVIFESYHVGAKVLLYTPDLKEYIESDRHLYFDLFNLPSPVSRNMDELKKTIENFNDEQYEDKRKEFVSKVGYYNEDASVLIADKIVKIIGGEI